MATTRITTVFQFRRDTTENWLLNKDVVPAAGEPCFDLTAHTLKIGDGTLTYENLPVIGGASVEVTADGESIVFEDGVFKLAGFKAAEVGAQPRKNANGELEWVVPTVTNESLQESVTELEDAIGTPADGETEATGLYAELDSKADASVIGEIPEGQTLVQMISEAAYDDTALAGRVTDAEGKIEVLESKAHEHTNKEIIDGVTAEKVAAWDAAEQNAVDRVLGYLATEEVNASYDTLKEVAAWIESDTTASAELVTRVGDLEKVGAEKNVIASVDTAQFNVDENRNLTLLDIAMGKVTGLQDALDDKADKGTTLAEYGITDAYTKTETETRLQEVVDGLTDTSETAASVAQALEAYKTSNDTRVDTVEAKLATIAEGAQVNVIESVKVGDTVLEIIEKAVTIPVGAGLKASDEITIAEDGTLGVGTINFSKIVQTAEETVIMDGGGAAN